MVDMIVKAIDDPEGTRYEIAPRDISVGIQRTVREPTCSDSSHSARSVYLRSGELLGWPDPRDVGARRRGCSGLMGGTEWSTSLWLDRLPDHDAGALPGGLLA
jgi:hypothetical protein